VSEQVWTAEQVLGDTKWYWLREVGARAIEPWCAEMRYEGPEPDSIFCERSILPIPSAERHHALEELAEAAKALAPLLKEFERVKESESDGTYVWAQNGGDNVRLSVRQLRAICAALAKLEQTR
jgi:hypothetical protein